MIEVEIVNKIAEKIEEYQNRTGATKTWIAKQMDLSNSRLYELINARVLRIDTLVKVAFVLQCEVSDLYEYKVTRKD